MDWLPDDALTAPAVLAAIDGRIEEWSARWFGDRKVRRQDKPGIASSPAPRHGWRRLGGGIWADWNGSTAQAIALHALDRGDLRPRPAGDDERLLERLGERIADDLADCLGASPAHGGAGPARGLACKLGTVSQAFALPILIDLGTMAVLRKRQCPPWRPAPAAPVPLAMPLAAVPVDFEVALGSVSMSLAELERIEPGDTIVLPRRIGEPIPLSATATGTTIGHATLVHEAGQLTLTAS
ncbi:MAG: FliM/FliN family flagellar motor switch protein [Novosphingobium sp.]